MIYASHSTGVVLALSALLGAFFGVLYDVLRFVREAFTFDVAGKYRKIVRLGAFLLTFFFDLFFFVFAGACESIFLFYTNDGIFRLSSIVVTVCGFCLYRVTLGKIIYALLKFFRKILKKIVIFSLNAIAFPVKSVYNILVRVSERFSLSESGSILKSDTREGGEQR